MARIVAIPKVGNLHIPDHVSDGEVQSASRAVHEDALRREIGSIVAFVADHSSAVKVSDHLKNGHEIAAILEKFPALAHLAGVGLKSQG
jgi:hypothetical protein